MTDTSDKSNGNGALVVVLMVGVVAFAIFTDNPELWQKVKLAIGVQESGATSEPGSGTPAVPPQTGFGTPTPGSGRSIVGSWHHQFGLWKIDFRADGTMQLYMGFGWSQGKYKVANGREIEITLDDGAPIRAEAAFNRDGHLVLAKIDDGRKQVPIYGSNDLAIFVPGRN